MALTQFSAALLFALCTSVVFGITQRAELRMMVGFCLFFFDLFAGSVIAASWIFYFIKH